MIQIPTEHVTVLLFFHFTVATARIRTAIEKFFPPSFFCSSYHHLKIGDDSKCVIKRNLFYFMLMGRNGKRETYASIYFLYFACHISGLSVQSSSSKSARNKPNWIVAFSQNAYEGVTRVVIRSIRTFAKHKIFR